MTVLGVDRQDDVDPEDPVNDMDVQDDWTPMEENSKFWAQKIFEKMDTIYLVFLFLKERIFIDWAIGVQCFMMNVAGRLIFSA